MDKRLALIALAAIPALAVLFDLLAQSRLRPLTACLVGLAVYWALLALTLRREGWSLAWRWPHKGLTALMGLGLTALAIPALPLMGQLSPHVLAAVALAAALNGTLEEAFWRGALVPDLNASDGLRALLPVALFTAWHLAPAVGLAALDAPGGTIGLLLGAAGLGALLMAVRLSSGSAGIGAAAHAAVNFCTFGAICAINPGPV